MPSGQNSGQCSKKDLWDFTEDGHVQPNKPRLCLLAMQALGSSMRPNNS